MKEIVKKFNLLTIVTVLLLGVSLAFGCGTSEPETTTQIIEDITVEAAHQLITDNDDNPDFMIIDVRTPGEYAQGHIENSVLIDISGDDFRGKIGELDKDGKYLVYCRSGSRSAQAVDIMAELGFKEVYNMLGGIGDWTAAGFPTVK